MFLFALLSFIVVAATYVIFKKKYSYWKKRNVPFPEPTFIFGNIGKVLTLRTTMAELCYKIYNDYKGYPYVGIFNFWNPAIVVRDPELIKDVLVKQFSNFHDNWIEVEREVDPTMGNNPFSLRGEEWKTVRAQLTPQFTSSKMKLMTSVIQQSSKNMIEYIKKETASKGSNTFEAKDLSARFTADNILSSGFGLEGRSFLVEVPDAYKVGEQIATGNITSVIKQTAALFFPTLRKLFKITFLGNPIPKLFSDFILEAIKYRDENNVTRKDYLDFMRELKVKLGPEITDEFLVAHAFTFFMDGFETTSIPLSFAMLELCLNPDVQKTAREEIQTILKKHDGNMTYEALQEMVYLDNVIFETLRMRPAIKFFSRICTDDYEFPPPKDSAKNIIIEKGTLMVIPAEAVHYDPNYYPNPEKFDPNRFTEEVKNLRPKCTFLGFGEGPRICLGRKLGFAQVKVGLAAILAEFELRLNKNTVLPVELYSSHIFNSPKSGILIDFYQK